MTDRLPDEKAPPSPRNDEKDDDDDDDGLEEVEDAPVPPPDIANSATAAANAVALVRSRSAGPSLHRVSTHNRVGLLSRLSLIYEAEDPKSYPRRLKWFLTFNVALAAAAAPVGSAIILPALADITRDFGTTAFIANMSVAFYMLSMSIFPLWWSALSEAAGRRTVYIFSFALYLLFNILSALSTSISMFIVMRVLSGGSAAAVQAVGAGTIADIWDVKERGSAVGIFYLGPLCGPLLAPIVGGALTLGFGWRSTQWFQVIFGGVVLCLVLFALPETHRHSSTVAAARAEADAAAAPEKDPAHALARVPSRQSVAAASRAWAAVARRIFLEPLRIIRYLRFPAIAFLVYYASIAFGALYFLNISVEKTFAAPPYAFSSVVVGALYLFNSVGYLLASVLGGRWVDAIMHRQARRAGRVDARGRLVFRPEDRMGENIWAGAALMPAALLWYGWCAQARVFWFPTVLANFFYGVGSMLIFGSATTMLTEFMPRKASNGVALNNFCRNILSFLGTLLADPLIDAIGNGWLFTILAVICALSAGVIVLMKKKGDEWRERMDKQMD